MDKLEPIIRNRFWILAGLVIPLGLYGYFSANSALKASTEERVKTIDGVKSAVSTGNEPNEDYTKKLEKINTTYTSWVDEERINLWEYQKERMTWPISVANQIPDEFMGEIALNPLFTYKGEYKQLMNRLVEYAQPVMPLPKTKTEKLPTWKQKIILAATLPAAQFGSLSITSEEMWNAQMDIWLTTLLLDSIRNINEDKDSVTDSIIRRVDRLELMGGTGEPVLAGAAVGGSESGMDEMYMGAMESGGGPAGADGGAVTSSVSFQPSQEFGLASEGGAAGGTDYMGESSGMDTVGTSASAMRYIAESEDAAYLERGFYMSVIIMQNKIPEFMAELTNAPWPIRVVRFQMGENPYFTEKTSRRTGGGFDSMYDSEMTDMQYTAGAQNYGNEMGEMGRTTGSLYGGISSGLPESATGALNHPDLVQLDLAGVITIYKQPTELIAAMTEAEATEGVNISADAVTSENMSPASDPGSDNPASVPVEPLTDPDPAIIPETTETPETTNPSSATPGAVPADTPAAEPVPLVVE